MRHVARVPDWQPEGRSLMRPSVRDIDDHRRRTTTALPLQRAAPMTRFVAVFVAVGVAIAGAGVARAEDTGMLPGGAAIKWEMFSIQQSSGFKLPDQEEARRHLNLAHCVCAKASAGEETEVRYDLKLSA